MLARGCLSCASPVHTRGLVADVRCMYFDRGQVK